MAGAPPCRALSFMTHRILTYIEGVTVGRGRVAGGYVGQSGVAGICVRLLFVWCLGALVPCVVCSLYTKAYQ